MTDSLRDGGGKEAARKFQDAMLKMGLGVTISVPDRKPARITTYCKACKTTSRGSVDVCPKCSEPIPDA